MFELHEVMMSSYVMYKLLKAGAILFVICLVGLWQGFTGRDH